MFSYLMPDTVNIRKITTFDSYGNMTTADTPTKGKIEYEFKKIIDRQGESIVSSGTFRTLADITINDMIEVGGEYKQFIQVQPQTDFDGKVQYMIGWF